MRGNDSVDRKWKGDTGKFIPCFLRLTLQYGKRRPFMTTRRIDIRRERPGDWPIFDGLDLPRELGVLSVEINRLPAEKIKAAVREASDNFRTAWMRASLPRRWRMWLLVASRPVRRADRIAMLQATRLGLWGATEKAGIELPRGARSETKVSYNGGLTGFAGSISLESDDIPVALEVTRRENAICLAVDISSADPLFRVASIRPERLTAKVPDLFLLGVKAANDASFAVRGFGAFDDRMVGVEVFGSDSIINTLEMSLGVSQEGARPDTM